MNNILLIKIQIHGQDLDNVLHQRDELIGNIPEESKPIQLLRERAIAQYNQTTPWIRLKETLYPEESLDSELESLKYSALIKVNGVIMISVLSTVFQRIINLVDENIRRTQVTKYLTKEAVGRSFFDKIIYRSVSFSTNIMLRSGFLGTGCFAGPLIYRAYKGDSSPYDYAIPWSSTLAMYLYPSGLLRSGVGLCTGLVSGLVIGSLLYSYEVREGRTYREIYLKHLELAM